MDILKIAQNLLFFSNFKIVEEKKSEKNIYADYNQIMKFIKEQDPDLLIPVLKKIVIKEEVIDAIKRISGRYNNKIKKKHLIFCYLLFFIEKKCKTQKYEDTDIKKIKENIRQIFTDEVNEFERSEQWKEWREFRDYITSKKQFNFWKKYLNSYFKLLKFFKNRFIGHSEKISELKNQISRALFTEEPYILPLHKDLTDLGNIYIHGETGSGKELVAESLSNGCFLLPQNSTNEPPNYYQTTLIEIPSQLIESELFGITKGRATGVMENEGIFQKFNIKPGYLFIDEIGEIPDYIQSKILRVLQNKEYHKIGSYEEPQEISFRLISASNKDINNDKKFRVDLYSRISHIQIEVPPLRERRCDINDIVKNFISKKFDGDFSYNKSIRKNFINELERPIIKNLFLKYKWKYNVRELLSWLNKYIINREEAVSELQNLCDGQDKPGENGELSRHHIKDPYERFFSNRTGIKEIKREYTRYAIKNSNTLADASKILGASRSYIDKFKKSNKRLLYEK